MKKRNFGHLFKIAVSMLLLVSILSSLFIGTNTVNAATDNAIALNVVSSDSYNALNAVVDAKNSYSHGATEVKKQEDAAIDIFNTTASNTYDPLMLIQERFNANADMQESTTVWYLSEKELADNGSGLMVPAGDYLPRYIHPFGQGYSMAGSSSWLFYWNGSDMNHGLGILNNQVLMWAQGRADYLTFNAPKTGIVKISETTVNGGVNWGLNGADEQLGVAIYKNNEKVWPTDSDYSVMTNASPSITIPELELHLNVGDKLYFGIIPLKNDYGCCILNPVVTYKSNSMPESDWSYSVKPVVTDGSTGYLVPDSTKDWIQPSLSYTNELNGNVISAGMGTSNYLVENGSPIRGYGVSIDNKIVSFIDSYQVIAFTYTAKKTGKIEISDRTSTYPNITTTGWRTWEGAIYGFAVYNGNEKIWPAEGFYTLSGNSEIVFPTITDINVTEGDKLHLAIIPLQGCTYDFIRFSPQVSYQLDAPWGYSALVDGVWRDKSLGVIQGAAVAEYLSVKDTINGFGVYENKLTSYMPNGYTASGLTFTAPKSGNIRLYDPDMGMVGPTSTGGPFWALNEEGKYARFAIYKNDEKIWPYNADYYELNHYIDGTNNHQVGFPDINLKVAEGDKIRIAFFNGSCGYVSYNPQIDYVSGANASYNAVDAVSAQENVAIDWRYYNENNWIYEESAISDQNDYNYFLPTGEWNAPAIRINNHWNSSSEYIRTAVPNMYYYWNGNSNNGAGIGTLNGKIVMACQDYATKAPALTFVTPMSGKVKLYDPDGGLMGAITPDTYTLNGQYNIGEDTIGITEKLGVAIFKNDEKIWPADGEIDGYYVLSSDGSKNTEFPELYVDVTKGDKIRIAFAPLALDWGYVELNPQVDYVSIDGEGYTNEPIGVGLEFPNFKRYFEGEEFDFDAIVRYADGKSQNMVDNAYLSVNYTQEIGINAVEVTYDDGTYAYSETFNVEVMAKKYGDVNADKLINSLDLTALRKYLLNNDKLHEVVADVTADEQINVIDLVRMKKYLADDGIVLGPKVNWIDPNTDVERTPEIVTYLSSDNNIIKNNETYLQYGIQVVTERASNTTIDDYEIAFSKAAEVGYKKVLAQVKWREIEPAKDNYNLYKVKRIIDFANKYDLELEILWFGSNVCGSVVDAPNYVLNNTTAYPRFGNTFDYSNVLLKNRESAAIQVIMNYIYDYDSARRVSMIQIENEPNFNDILEGQEEAFATYVNEIGRAVKESAYSVVTRINIAGSIKDEYYADLVALEYIDMVGPDAYSHSWDYISSEIDETSAINGNIAHLPEAAVHFYDSPSAIIKTLAKGAGFYGYELMTDGEQVGWDMGIFRKSDRPDQWVYRDGTEKAYFEWSKDQQYDECKTTDIIAVNKIINDIGNKMIGGFSVVESGNSVTVDGVEVAFITTDTRNTIGAVISDDNALYIFTPAELGGSFTVNGVAVNASVGYINAEGVWIETATGNTNAVEQGLVYKIGLN